MNAHTHHWTTETPLRGQAREACACGETRTVAADIENAPRPRGALRSPINRSIAPEVREQMLYHISLLPPELRSEALLADARDW